MKGFTLIELLVVVLIIGILSSVALPQYQKAVKKTRLMRLAPLIKAMADAEEAYYLANGQYTPFSSELDISWPDGSLAGSATDDGYLRFSDGTVVDLLSGTSYLTGSANAHVKGRTKEGVSYIHYLDHSSHPGVRLCTGDEGLCKSFGGEAFNGGWKIP
ncbi:MAG: type IV pilin protein [Candidatus Avelusimicrobium sp.]|uniref:type IV pilin protein n=1 Tax=Candidatus Avelusimicrobium sp. TaxID=3048833 RepID=UPI003F0C7CDB